MKNNDRLLFYVMQGDKKLKASAYLVGAQLARECMIDAGEGDASMQIVGSDGKIYPNSLIS